MAKQEFSIKNLADRLVTEADAYLLLEELRWGGEPPACPKCGTVGQTAFMQPRNGAESRKTRTGTTSQRRVWQCRACRKQFSVLTDTIFHGTKISIRTWLFVIFEFVASKNSASAWEISRKYSITNESAWHMLHRIREAMRMEPLAGLMVGAIASDETWVGGDPSNKHVKDRPARKRHRWERPKTDKPTVHALVNRDSGEVRSSVIADVSGATLRKAIADQVDMAASTLETDEWKGYKPVGREFRSHSTVTHAANVYVRDGITTNAVEGYFSQLKRSLDGTHHQISRQHLPRYLAQFDFMRTHHALDDSQRMRLLLGRVEGRRLTYRPLVQDS